MKIRLGIPACAASLLSGCFAPPLLMGAASLGALGGQTVLTQKVGKNAGNRAMRKTETALAIGTDVDPNAGKISELVRSGDTERWTAELPSGRYFCTKKAGYMKASCEKN